MHWCFWSEILFIKYVLRETKQQGPELLGRWLLVEVYMLQRFLVNAVNYWLLVHSTTFTINYGIMCVLLENAPLAHT